MTDGRFLAVAATGSECIINATKIKKQNFIHFLPSFKRSMIRGCHNVIGGPGVDVYAWDACSLPRLTATQQRTTESSCIQAGCERCSCMQGWELYALQSCMNHSNTPNCSSLKDRHGRDGTAVLAVLRPITQGEDLTISCVDDFSLYSPA